MMGGAEPAKGLQKESGGYAELERSIAVESFKAARDEIANRIKLRDQTLAAYLAAVVSIVAFVLTAKAEKTPAPLPTLLLFIPALTFAAAKVIADNHNMVNAIAQYQQMEFCGWMRAMRDGALAEFIFWENSTYLRNPHFVPRPEDGWFARRLRIAWDAIALTDIIVLDGPAAAATLIYLQLSSPTTRLGRLGIAIGLALLAWSAWLLFNAALKRRARPGPPSVATLPAAPG